MKDLSHIFPCTAYSDKRNVCRMAYSPSEQAGSRTGGEGIAEIMRFGRRGVGESGLCGGGLFPPAAAHGTGIY